MKNFNLVLYAIVFFLLGFPINTLAVEISASKINDLKKNNGKWVIVTGFVYSTYKAMGGKVRFLNLGKDNTKSFAVVIFDDNLKNFTSEVGEPTKYYDKKTIYVVGKINIYKGKPEIIADTPGQISFAPIGISTFDKSADEYDCFYKTDLQGGDHLWKGKEEKKCVQRKHYYCYVDESVPYPPLLCFDKRDGSLLSFSD